MTSPGLLSLVLVFFLSACKGMVNNIQGWSPDAARATVMCSGGGLDSSRFAAGSGTSGDPYMICTAAQLALIASADTWPTGYYELARNIDLASYGNWEPIGSTQFQGHFDGGGFEISNLSIGVGGGSFRGLFYYLGNGAVVTDLTIRVVSIVANSYAGAVAGQTNPGSTISSVHVFGPNSGAGDVRANTNYAGGITGYNQDLVHGRKLLPNSPLGII